MAPCIRSKNLRTLIVGVIWTDLIFSRWSKGTVWPSKNRNAGTWPPKHRDATGNRPRGLRRPHQKSVQSLFAPHFNRIHFTMAFITYFTPKTVSVSPCHLQPFAKKERSETRPHWRMRTSHIGWLSSKKNRYCATEMVLLQCAFSNFGIKFGASLGRGESHTGVRPVVGARWLGWCLCHKQISS